MIKTDEKGKTVEKSLSELAEYWKQLERKTVEQRQKADIYYENTLMKPIIQAFVENNGTCRMSDFVCRNFI